MKFMTIAIIVLAATTSSKVVLAPNIDSPLYQNLYACALYPMCDKELTSPVSKPKDSKTETEDAIDEKLA
jgi:hypothetical protein